MQGATRKDQAWISGTQETGIRVCHWNRPQPHKASILYRKASPKPVVHVAPSSSPATVAAPEPAVPVPVPAPAKPQGKTQKEINKMREQLRSLELKLHRT